MSSRIIATIATACLFALGASTGITMAAADTANAGKAKPAKAAKPASKDGAKPQDAGTQAAGPKIDMGEAPAKGPGKDRDMRHCLDLPTAKEVIKCSEGK